MNAVTDSQIEAILKTDTRGKIPLRKRNFDLVNGYHRGRNSSSLSQLITDKVDHG